MGRFSENELATAVIDVAFHIHRKLGPGLLESAYEAIMVHELKRRGFRVESQVSVPLMWGGIEVETAYRADLIVDDKLIVELKSIEQIAPVHKKQLLTYLRIADCRLGLLINFGCELFKNGVSRVVNNLEE